jgi:biotin carboxylase
MPESRPLTVLCLASDVKGHDFLRECRRQGCRVILVTRQMHADGDWPREAIDDMYFLPSLLDRDDLLKGVSWLARTTAFDRIVALDDFDVEQAALLREHLRVPGMGETTARHFRDKLAMRMRAREAGGPRAGLRARAQRRRGAPVHRARAGAVGAEAALRGLGGGIKKVATADELWRALDALGDARSLHLVERFVPGDVYHVDGVVSELEMPFVVTSRYGEPPLDVMHGGGLFVTRTLPPASPEAREPAALTRELVAALGLVRGVTHTEFIRGRDDGRFYFLETAARVGGAHIAEVVEAATGVNLWAEWARVEIAGGGAPYEPPARPRRARGDRALARPPGVAGHVGVRRPGGGVARPPAAPRGAHRRVARLGARGRAARRVRPPLLPRLLRERAGAREGRAVRARA